MVNKFVAKKAIKKYRKITSADARAISKQRAISDIRIREARKISQIKLAEQKKLLIWKAKHRDDLKRLKTHYYSKGGPEFVAKQMALIRKSTSKKRLLKRRK